MPIKDGSDDKAIVELRNDYKYLLKMVKSSNKLIIALTRRIERLESKYRSMSRDLGSK